MKQRRLRNGKYRINYFDRLFPLYLMLLTAGLSWGLQTGNKLRIQQVQARGGDNASWVELANATTPTPTPQLQVVAPTPVVPTATPTPTESGYIELAVDEFLPKRKSESLMIMHCLANRESLHGEKGKPSDPHGDNGLAGGPFQFHQATWVRMRKQMGEPELSRYDFKEAARTTAWAIANGSALEWGPILRASNGSSFAACQKPSWYK